MRNLEEFNGIYKDSETTCFIIGSGTSIHFQNLEPLKEHVTIAVNSGYVAAPWAKYFISDDWSIARWSFYFKSLKESEVTIPLLYEDKLGNTAEWFGSRAVLFRHTKGINIPDKYNHTDKRFFIGETRTSVGTAIMVAHIMGCSKIVLLGIDGCRDYGKRYFWQLPYQISPVRDTSYDIPRRNDNVPIDKYQKIKILGKITDKDLVDINRTWLAFGQAVNKKCKVYNASEISVLSVFPKVSLESFFEKH